MKVKELLELLNKYNPEAIVQVVVDCHPYDFEVWYGSSEGCTPETCDNVSVAVYCNCECENC